MPLQFLLAGESHGKGLTGIVVGYPAGVRLDQERIRRVMKARQAGHGRSRRQQIEQDEVEFTAGLRHGVTMGSPIALWIANQDHVRWREEMAPWPVEGGSPNLVTRPRPGHVDLAGALKWDHNDIRNALEHASARLTAMRVAIGCLAQALMDACAIQSVSHVLRIGRESSGPQADPFVMRDQINASPVRCAAPEPEARMIAAIDHAKEAGDSLGGVVEVRVRGLPAGMGSNGHWTSRLDGRTAQAVMSIQAFKAVEIGDGVESASSPGSRTHDPIGYDPAQVTGAGHFIRSSNHAGGVEGGLSNGEDLIVRGWVKPIPTLMNPLPSVNIHTHQPEPAHVERADVCVVPAASVIAEAAVCWVVAETLVERFGGDTISQLASRVDEYRRYLVTR
ncbi:MAG: Chorismate synthase [Myxococcota bacterium]|nr:Chorismate synthase [Myxococcota bacterium]